VELVRIYEVQNGYIDVGIFRPSDIGSVEYDAFKSRRKI
jgi:hypothetical protein